MSSSALVFNPQLYSQCVIEINTAEMVPVVEVFMEPDEGLVPLREAPVYGDRGTPVDLEEPTVRRDAVYYYGDLFPFRDLFEVREGEGDSVEAGDDRFQIPYYFGCEGHDQPGMRLKKTPPFFGFFYYIRA